MDEDGLDLAKRSSLVARLLDGLGKIAPGALVELCGSLAEAGGGDRFSDIDLRLSVPGEEFESGLRRIHRTLGDIEAVRLFRLDPDAAPTSYSRLLYALFRDVPLFWRLDLEVVATPPLPSPEAAPFEGPWSRPVSALMIALAATKAAARGDDLRARELLCRGFERIGEPLPTAPTVDQVRALADACTRHDPSVEDLADQVVGWSRLLRV